MAKKKRKKSTKSKSRRLAAKASVVATLVLVFWGCAGNWFVHHPQAWHAEVKAKWPGFLIAPLYWIGNPVGDVTDGLGLTGHDAVYEFDEEAPSGSVFFAGAPRRVGAPAPADIRILDRGEFAVGWSDKLRHPVWCAYHVTPERRHEDGKRPGFVRDKSVPAAPRPDSYTHSNYDRGHMVPNHAIISRYGEEERRKTFLMSNISPQSPALNRGVWRQIEHRIADLWTARYGEIWVVVGCLPSQTGETLSGSDIDVPSGFYQIVMAQEGMDVRALAVIYPQNVPWSAWPTRGLITIDELERLTGLDFNPDLPGFIQDPLEAELPSRLWPVRLRDIFKQIWLRFG